MRKILKGATLLLGDLFVEVVFIYMNDTVYWHAFNLVNNFGPIRIKRLLNYFSNLENAWSAKIIDLQQAGMENFVINNFVAKRKEIDLEKEWAQISPDIKIITILDAEYPKMLKQIPSAPFIIYLKGNKTALLQPAIAIVGSRNMTEYGTKVCQDLTQQLSSLGLVVVSGLAEGIDTVAHQTCLANNGKTIAVLGSGINEHCIFPAYNKKLAAKIISSQGAIISEYAPNLKAQRQFFPARNRIISGLSLGTVIIEAREKSGALITAYQALEQNREVFSVPGSIYSSRSSGCHKLIQKGAKLVQNVQDIIDELPIKTAMPSKTQIYNGVFSADEQQILRLFAAEPLHIDKIIKSCRLSKSCLLANLTSLELKGIILKNNNNYYLLCQKI